MDPKRVKDNARKQRHRALVIMGLAMLALVVAGGIWIGIRAASGPKTEVSAAEAARLRDQGALFLDVRSRDEWSASHVPGSTLIPLDELEQHMNEIPRDRQVVVVCATGIRSRAGRDLLARAGFTNVVDMAGGLLEWKAQGYPLATGP